MRLPLRYNLRSLVQRRVRSALTALGLAAVVFSAILMIGLSRGLLESTARTAGTDNVIVLSKGAETMEFSAIDPQVLHLLTGLSYVRTEQGEPLASPEAYLSSYVQLPDDAGESERRGVVRGAWPVAFRVHDRLRLVDGTVPQRGFQAAVGRLVATKLGVPEAALAVGKTIDFEGQRWTITGHFEAPGTILESEIFCHLDDLLVATKRSDYSSIVLKTKDARACDDLVFDLATRTDVRVEAQTEQAYYAAIAKALKPVQAVSVAMTVILVLGAVMAGMNTMFTSILGRTREMGVLLVLGYKRKAVLASFVLESVMLALAGGVVGACAGSLLNGFALKIPMGAFRFLVDSVTLGIGLGLAVGIGVLGAVVPVARVARLRVVDALRAE